MVLVWDVVGAGAPSVVLGAAEALGAAAVLGVLVETAVKRDLDFAVFNVCLFNMSIVKIFIMNVH